MLQRETGVGVSFGAQTASATRLPEKATRPQLE